MKSHSETNLAEVERLKKMPDEKEVALVKQPEEVKQWMKKEIDAKEKL